MAGYYLAGHHSLHFCGCGILAFGYDLQNQITIKDRVLINKKVVSFIITGGQDNIQAVSGQLMSFFSELGFYLPQFPFIAHSRGWTAEDMEQNVAEVKQSEELREGARALVERAVETACGLLKG